jgi:hypothetical protein
LSAILDIAIPTAIPRNRVRGDVAPMRFDMPLTWKEDFAIIVRNMG